MSYTFESIGTEEGIEYVNVIDASGETIAFMLPRAQAETEFVAGSEFSLLLAHPVSAPEVEAMLDVIAAGLNANTDVAKSDESGVVVTIALPAERYSSVQIWDLLMDAGHMAVNEVLTH